MQAEPLRVVARLCPPSKKPSESQLCAVTGARKRSVQLLNPPKADKGTRFEFEYNNVGDHSVLQTFQFDHAFAPGTTNETVFSSSAASLVHWAIEGFRCTCFAHGYVGTGKTYTMHGTADAPGIIPRSIEMLFECINEIVEGTQGEELFEVKVGFVQLFDGKFFDLLQDRGPHKNPSTTLPQIELHEDPFAGPHLRGSLSLRSPTPSADDALALYHRGLEVLTTGWRSEFRGHALFMMHIERHDLKTGDIRLGRLNLVDLAGYESVRKSKPQGYLLRDACINNKSLTSLGNVLAAASRRPNNPSAARAISAKFRESKLTFFLKDCIGGNSKSLLIATMDPSLEAFRQTKACLDFAQRASMVTNFPHVIHSPHKSAHSMRRRPAATVATPRIARTPNNISKQLFDTNIANSDSPTPSTPLSDLANIVRNVAAAQRVRAKDPPPRLGSTPQQRRSTTTPQTEGSKSILLHARLSSLETRVEQQQQALQEARTKMELQKRVIARHATNFHRERAVVQDLRRKLETANKISLDNNNATAIVQDAVAIATELRQSLQVCLSSLNLQLISCPACPQWLVLCNNHSKLNRQLLRRTKSSRESSSQVTRDI